MNPLVSVVVPTYNGEAFVRATLESIFAQTYSPLEVIVCDDGSVDGTLAILDSFAGRIRLLRQPNGGVARARNRATHIARGEYLAFLDHDDLWEPNMLATLVPILARDPGLGLVYADAWIIDAHGQKHGRRGKYLKYASGHVYARLLRGNFIPVETTLMRTALFRELGGCDPAWRYLEDFELCLRIAQRAPIAFHPEPLASYRIHEHNLSHERDPMLVEWLALMDALRAEERGLDREQRAILDEEAGRLCADLAWRALRRRDLAGVSAWLARAGAHAPARRVWRVKTVRALLAMLPRSVGDAWLALLPRRNLYGVPIASAPAVPAAAHPVRSEPAASATGDARAE